MIDAWSLTRTYHRHAQVMCSGATGTQFADAVEYVAPQSSFLHDQIGLMWVLGVSTPTGRLVTGCAGGLPPKVPPPTVHLSDAQEVILQHKVKTCKADNLKSGFKAWDALARELMGDPAFGTEQLLVPPHLTREQLTQQLVSKAKYCARQLSKPGGHARGLV